ncbi:PLP-dependent aminotransferase family protein [Cohnella candidum]|uniref:PLP-dependent aminotransferase family protein n=1 Tax=Cohnella candidum TaxID=2674991 RepID=A0A3G3JYC3_9BACL|nr:PLP-dependent aminotransferase family protein [Cohnella candidum]AYQ72509.1 PLP-dependent aminotransferase family protein [Cohnella candidum]
MTGDMASAGTKTEQIYALLRDRILQGQLRIGRRLPSTRDLSGELGASRSVIVEVYEQLIAEGYVEGRVGSGTFVADWKSGGFVEGPLSGDAASSMPITFERTKRNPYIDFMPSFPSLQDVPLARWTAAYRECAAIADPAVLGYGDPAGGPELRLQIARLLLQTKGFRCSPAQVIVTAGATQALSLLSKLLLAPGKTIVTEDPTANFILDIFVSSGANVEPVPVDRHGLCVTELKDAIRPAAVFVTPSHQFPFGGILPIQRRLQLLEYARRTGCYIIEDDYDSEFRYSGMPVRAMREWDAERVIYVGTFSKKLFPALRIGYMVVPEALVEPLVHIKKTADFHVPALPQLALARFMAEGQLDRHVARMKRVYARRRARLLASLRQWFGSDVETDGDAAGLHLVADFSGVRFDDALTEAIKERGVLVYPAESFAIRKGRYESKLILGFGNVTERQIEDGVRTLADVLKNR